MRIILDSTPKWTRKCQSCVASCPLSVCMYALIARESERDLAAVRWCRKNHTGILYFCRPVEYRKDLPQPLRESGGAEGGLPCFLGCLQSVNRTAPRSKSFMPTVKFRVLDTEVGI